MIGEKKTNKKIIGLILGIIAVLIVVISSTYAYWQVTKSQETPNSITSQCLSLEMSNQTGTFGLEDVYPMEDSEGLSKAGFTFEVVNNCDRDIAYIIGMDSIEIDYDSKNLDGYLLDSSVKISLDNTTPKIYDDLEAIDHISEDNKYTIRNSKEINTVTVKAKDRNTHNIKAWIDFNAPITENNRVFGGRVFIIAGQFIEPLAGPTPEACFTMDGGEIIGYDEACGTSVVIPATVNGVAVTTIDSNAFKEMTTLYNYDFVSVINSEGTPLRGYLTDHSKVEETKEWAEANNFGHIELFLYEGTPTLAEGERLVYCNKNANPDEMCVMPDGHELSYTKNLVSINELDLSQATNLEIIEAVAFSNHELKFDDEIGMIDSFYVQYDSQITSLTSLKFGENKELKLGLAAFNGIDVTNLVVYSNMVAEEEILDYFTDNGVTKYEAYLLGYFAGSKIDNLTIKHVNGYESIGDALYVLIDANQITIEEGITTIEAGGFESKENGSLYGKNIILPNSINNLGYGVFRGCPNSSTISILRTKDDFLTNVTTDGTWYGNAKVISSDGLSIYE